MSETQSAMVPKQEALEKLNRKVGELIALGEKIEVKDAATCLEAKQFSIQIKSYQKAVDLYADGDIQDAKERLSTLQGAKKMLLAPVVAISEAVETKRKRWEEDERRKAEAEQRRLQEEARVAQEKKAKEEREERERVAAEERKRKEKEIEAARKAGDLKAREAQRLQKEAREEEERKRQQAAKEAQETAAAVPQVEVRAAIPTLQGTMSRRNWKWRFLDESKIPREFLVPDETKIGQFVRNEKRAGEVIPGVEAYSE